MKALLKDNIVVDIAEKEFPVHPSLTWIDCDESCKHGMKYQDGKFQEVEVKEEPLLKSELELKIEALWEAVANKNEEKMRIINSIKSD